MSVTYARGFRAATTTAGFKPSGLPDLASLVGDPGTTAAGPFTTNRMAVARAEMAGPEIAIGVALGEGPGRSRGVGCDLSCGEYTT